MRFGFLTVAAIAGAIYAGPRLPSIAAPTAQTSSVLAELLPLRPIYDHVMKVIASGDSRPSFAVGTPVAAADWTALSRLEQNYKSEFDPAKMARINGENAANRIREFNDKQEDIRNYASNPAGWHGAPPF